KVTLVFISFVAFQTTVARLGAALSNVISFWPTRSQGNPLESLTQLTPTARAPHWTRTPKCNYEWSPTAETLCKGRAEFRRLAALVLVGPGTAPEALPHCSRIVRDGDNGQNGDHNEKDHLVLFRVRVGQDLAGDGIVRMLGKGYRTLSRSPGD